MKAAVVAVVCFLHISGLAYGANPNYSYHVKIDDPAHINFQEKAETRKGEDAQGFYSVLEPNGALRTVSYIADERGFNPVVSYSYGHPQSSVSVHSAIGPSAVIQKTGVYAPAYVSDNRVQIVDKSNIYAAPPPALNLQTFALPGPSAPVVVPAPLRQVTPVVKASAAIAHNYAPAYVPPPAAYLPPRQVVAVAPPPPQVIAVAPPPPPPPSFVAQAIQVPQPQVFAIPRPPPAISVVDIPPPPPAVLVKKLRPSKYLTVPAAVPTVVKSTPAIAVIKDSYSEPPRDTFRDPDAPSYPDAIVKVKEPTADYGPPEYLPPPPLAEVPAVKVRVVQPKVKVVQPVIQQQVALELPPPPQVFVQNVVAPPPVAAIQKYVAPPQVAVQKVVAAPPPVALNPGLYAGAIGFHTLTANPDSYVHAYGTQGFQVTTSRKFNKAVLAVPQVQKVVQPAPVYGPPAVAVQPAPVYGPPAISVQRVVQPAPVYGPPAISVQKVVEPAPVYGPPAIALQPAPVYGPPQRVIQPKPVYGPPLATQLVHAAPAPLPQFVQAPLPVPVPAPVALPQPVVSAAPLPLPIPQQLAVAAPIPAAPIAAGPVLSLTGKKQNPLTFAYGYEQGGAKVTHSYSGSGW